MNTANFFQDLSSGALTEVVGAVRYFDDVVRGLTAKQQFFIYPDNTVVSVVTCDGSASVQELDEEDSSIFRHYNKEYFYAN